ncbi:MAG: restriction endonuclease subunit S [Candidatus Accumulibacter sp.]|uniref:Restriction endonuclease subunit S n=1 Tax=Candidatus Accumulibacter affinis TaxID=2954384 RepID=A0A935TD73_9PROT|nr:restriction endonuclease subunit S [Candidatus Accumulibacter affinis]
MASNWPTVKIGDLLEIKHGFAFKGEHFTNKGEFVLLTPGNFKEEGGIKLKGDKEKFYSGQFPDEYLLDKGDIVVAMTDLTQNAPILGSSALIPQTGKYLHNQRLGKVINLKTDRAVPEFVFYLFNMPMVRGQIKGSATGATVKHTAPSRIYDVSTLLPPLPVQRRVAGILSAYDELIENSQRRIRILEAMARALYREWFVHFRFPGHEHHPRVASPRGEIPQGWEVKTLSAVAEVNRAQINARSAPEELQYIDISSVSPGQIDSITTYAFVDAPGRARRIVQHGDVLWSCVRPNRRAHAQVMHPEPSTIASTGFAVLTATKAPFTFLYFATTTDDFVAYLTNNATGAAYPAVTAATFEKADLLVPPAPLLKNFGGATIPMAEEIHTLQRQIQNLRRTRDLLLPRLLSGQIEVAAIPETAAA